ncbi:MAG: hypothetical protein JWN03_7839 [Nocardia sp.]|nr:hypothetical protein [Nocardia sp.]
MTRTTPAPAAQRSDHMPRCSRPPMQRPPVGVHQSPSQMPCAQVGECSAGRRARRAPSGQHVNTPRTQRFSRGEGTNLPGMWSPSGQYMNVPRTQRFSRGGHANVPEMWSLVGQCAGGSWVWRSPVEERANCPRMRCQQPEQRLPRGEHADVLWAQRLSVGPRSGGPVSPSPSRPRAGRSRVGRSPVGPPVGGPQVWRSPIGERAGRSQVRRLPVGRCARVARARRMPISGYTGVSR